MPRCICCPNTSLDFVPCMCTHPHLHVEHVRVGVCVCLTVIAKRVCMRRLKSVEPEYTTATELHYDAESGTFWSEDGSTDVGAAGGGGSFGADGGVGGEGGGGGGGGGRGRGGGGGGGRGGRAPVSAELQRRRNEQAKAKVANHSRKQAAAKKQQRGSMW